MTTFRAIFEDNQVIDFIFEKDLDSVLGKLDQYVQKHGDCKEMHEEISYNKYTGAKYRKIW